MANGKALAKRKKARRRPSKLELERMDICEDLMKSMVSRSTICKRLANEWKVKENTVRKIIQLVHERWAEESQDPAFRDQRRNMLRAAFEQSFLLARAQKDLNQANRALIEMGKLDGCYPDEKLRVEAQVAMAGVGINLSAMGFTSPEDVRDRIAELEERMAEGGLDAILAGVANSQMAGQHGPDENPGVALPFIDVEPAPPAPEAAPETNGNGSNGHAPPPPGVTIWEGPEED